MSLTMHFLGWSALEVFRGELADGKQEWTRIPLSWQLGDIRNCSYSASRQWIGISAEDRTHGRQVIAVYEASTGISRILLRADDVLGHSLSPLGTRLCFLQPSAAQGSADLCLYDLATEKATVLAKGAAAQSTIPAWFPDGTKIVYHSPDGWIEMIDLAEGRRSRLTEGQKPVVSPTADWIAFQRKNQIVIRRSVEPEERALPLRLGLRPKRLANGLSWSQDGRYLSFGILVGLVGKEMSFHLLATESGTTREIQSRYLQGLMIIE